MTEQPSRERAERCQHVWEWGEGRGGSGMEPSSGRDWLVVLPCCPPFPGWLRVKAPANWADDSGLQDVTNLLIVGAPALVLMWTMYLVSTSIMHKNKIAERQALPGRHWWWNSEAPSWGTVWGNHCALGEGEKRVYPLHLFVSAEPPQKVCVFFLEGKACAFDSRTEVEKLSLTYFLSSASLALSSQALWKSLNWETDSCNQTLAMRETSWILMGVLLLHEVGRAESV